MAERVWARAKKLFSTMSPEDAARLEARVPSSSSTLAPAVVELYDRVTELERQIAHLHEQLRNPCQAADQPPPG